MNFIKSFLMKIEIQINKSGNTIDPVNWLLKLEDMVRDVVIVINLLQSSTGVTNNFNGGRGVQQSLWKARSISQRMVVSAVLWHAGRANKWQWSLVLVVSNWICAIWSHCLPNVTKSWSVVKIDEQTIKRWCDH